MCLNLHFLTCKIKVSIGTKCVAVKNKWSCIVNEFNSIWLLKNMDRRPLFIFPDCSRAHLFRVSYSLLFCMLITLFARGFSLSYHVVCCFLSAFLTTPSFQSGCSNHNTQHELGTHKFWMVLRVGMSWWSTDTTEICISVFNTEGSMLKRMRVWKQ